MNLSNINWLAVVVAGLSGFLTGSIWYGPLFGKAWQRAVGLSDEEMKNANMGKMFGTAFVLTLVISFGFAFFFYGFGENPEMNAGMGAMYGFTTGIFFVFPSIWLNYLFARRPMNLIFIDAFYHIITYVVIGTIIGAWH